MHIIEPQAYSYPAMPGARATILGAGNVAKSLLLCAALLRPTIPFRVIARSIRSAELLRQFLNDLPRLEVEVVCADTVPNLSSELTVLTIGQRTGLFSRKTKKESLYLKNEKLIETLLPQLEEAVVIVVTNPTTAISRYLVDHGVQAYGVGVANDQLRFDNQLGTMQVDGQYLIGAHNFHELVLGSRHARKRTHFGFSHRDYKQLLASQDVKRPSWKNFPRSLLDYDWGALQRANAALPPEYRWYARQRIHSKFHSVTISCALAILNTICFFTKRLPLYNNFSLEMPLFLPGDERDVVLGWPVDGASMRPLELAFDDPEHQKLKMLSDKYRVRQFEQDGSAFSLLTPFGDRVILTGPAALVHEFFRTRLAHLFSINRASAKIPRRLASIRIEASREKIDRLIAGSRDDSWQSVVQHRGKNPQEHTDLKVLTLGGVRIVRFPGSDAIASFDEETRSVSIYCASAETLFHELRRLIRDEIGVPCLISRGARVLHAGLITFKGVTVLILGASGGGKTTAVLSLLTADAAARYGAAERTLAWVDANRVLALGIPESVTVFPGTLQQLPEFAALAASADAADLWTPARKTRLQLTDILEFSGRPAIQREVPVDLIIEVQYDAAIKDAEHAVVATAEGRKQVLWRNDLTEEDPVRPAWLGWCPKSPSRQLHELVEREEGIEVHTVRWKTIEALKSAIIDVVARKKLYDGTFEQATVRV